MKIAHRHTKNKTELVNAETGEIIAAMVGKARHQARNAARIANADKVRNALTNLIDALTGEKRRSGKTDVYSIGLEEFDKMVAVRFCKDIAKAIDALKIED